MNDTFTRLLARPWHFVCLDRGTKKARTSWNTDPSATAADLVEPCNLAALNGEKSDWLVTIDGDTPEVCEPMRALLPQPAGIYGRNSKPASKYLYRVVGAKPEIVQRKDVDGSVIVEYRAKGYDVLPGSQNPSGEVVEWFDEGAWTAVTNDEAALRQCVDLVATAVLLGKHWPRGSRHETAKHAAGFLARCRVPGPAIEDVIRCAARIAHDGEAEDRVRVARNTISVFENDGDVTGLPSLQELVGEEVCKRLRSWFKVKKERTAGAGRFPNSETGDAEAFADLFRDRVVFDKRRGEWLILNDHGIWTPDTVDQAYELATRMMRRRQEEASAIADHDEKGAAWKWAFDGESRSRLTNALSLASNKLADPGDQWNLNPFLVGCTNGLLDLTTGTLRPGTRDDRVTFSTRVEFDPSARSELWDRVLRDIFEHADVIDFVQRAFGYSLTGDAREDKWFLANGPRGRNGKGTVFGAVRGALGDYAHELPASAIDFNQRDKVPIDIAQLPGKRFVTCAEAGDSIRLNHDRVKQLTGGDPIRARGHYESFFEFQMMGKLWLMANTRPSVSDESDAFWARVIVIPFLKTFHGKEDRTIRPALEREPEHRRAVLAWLVAGALAWQARGLDRDVPAVIRQATIEYRKENESLTPFLDDCCVIDPNARAKADALRTAYVGWAARNGLRMALGPRKFGEALERQFVRKRANDGAWYFGVGLRDAKFEYQNDGSTLEFETVM